MTRSTITKLLLSTLFFGLIPTPTLGFTLDLFKDVSSAPGNNAGIQLIDLTWPDTSGENRIDGLVDVVWGKRSLYLDIASSNPIESQIFSHGATLAVGTDGNTFGVVDLSSDTSIIASATIDWDGWQSGDSYIDLEENGDDSLVLEVITIDQGVDLKFTITDQFDRVATITETVTNATTSQPIFFTYTDASNYSNVDFNNVKQIRLDIENTSTTALDFTFDFLETGKAVPFDFSPSLGIFISLSFFAFYSLLKKSS